MNLDRARTVRATDPEKTMSSRLPLLIVFVALALGLGGGLWYALREEAVLDPHASDLAPGGMSATEPEKPAEPEAELIAAEDDLAAPDERISAAAAVDDRSESFDLAGARWVEVRVAAPAGSPPDDSLVVFGFFMAGREDAEVRSDEVRAFERAISQTTDANELLEKAREIDAVAWAWRAIDATGVARLPFPEGADEGTVALDARYLYLEELEVVDFAEGATALVLEPALGAWITGRCRLPAGASGRGVTAESLEGKVSLVGGDIFETGRNRRRVSREVALEGPEFEFRGVPADVRYIVAAKVKKLVPYTDFKLEVAPGEHRQYEVVFELGGALSGRVTDEGGEGLEDARVRVSGQRMGFLLGGRTGGTETDAGGRWSLRGIKAGKYRVNADLKGRRGAESEEFELAADETIEGLTLVLARGTSIAGRVTWPDGRAVEGATVTATETAPIERTRMMWRNAATAGSGTTDATGEFTITGLGEGPFDVTATMRAEVPSRPGPEVERETQGEEAPQAKKKKKGPLWRASAAEVPPDSEGLALVLATPLRFTGVVRDDAGEPVAEFEVQASPTTGKNIRGASRVQAVSESFTPEDGTFTLVGVYPGEWTVSASAAGYTSAEDPTPLSIPHDGAPIELVLSRSASVSGQVIDPSGVPVAGARVAESTGRTGRSQVMFGGGDRGGVETDAEGRFQLEDLAVGGHSLVAHSAGWAPSASFAVDLMPAQALADVVLELRVGGRIVGEVFDESGAPIPGRRVSYGNNPLQIGFGGGDAASATTDSAGHFVLEHVEPGAWSVTASPGQNELLDTLAGATDESAFLGIFSQMLTVKVEVRDGEEVHVTLGAEPKRPVRVFGKITKAGEPVAGAQIFSIQEGGALMTGLKMSRSDEDGSYELTVDRPGAYVFGVGDDTLMRQVEFPVDVPDVDELELDLVAPVGRIEGTVWSSGGAAAAGVPVRLTPEGGGFSLSQLGGGERQTTGADGRFAFEDLWAGTYSLRAGGTPRFSDGGARWGTRVVGGIQLEADETVSGIDVTLAGAGKLEGLVRDGAGEPVAGVAIFVRDGAGRLLANISSTSTDAVGRFEYEGVAPGLVTVSARGDGVAAGDSAPVEVRAGAATSIELTVEPGTLLVVTVVDKAGEPVRASLVVTDAAGRAVEGMYGEAAVEKLFAEGISSREHKVGPLAAGKYVVRATARDGREARKPVTLKGQKERKLKLKLRLRD